MPAPQARTATAMIAMSSGRSTPPAGEQDEAGGAQRQKHPERDGGLGDGRVGGDLRGRLPQAA